MYFYERSTDAPIFFYTSYMKTVFFAKFSMVEPHSMATSSNNNAKTLHKDLSTKMAAVRRVQRLRSLGRCIRGTSSMRQIILASPTNGVLTRVAAAQLEHALPKRVSNEFQRRWIATGLDATQLTNCEGNTEEDLQTEEEGEGSEEKDPFARFPDDVNPETGEIGGPTGPEPTRYGDWERKGRVTDF